MDNHKTITFNIGEENRIVVENLNSKENIEKSIFSDVYIRLLTDLDNYCSFIDPSKIPDEDGFQNNIFAFIGERGSGKTSCMKSFANLLSGSAVVKSDYSNLNTIKFYCLDTIDPSFIDNDTNLIGIILANLYKCFLDFDKKREVNFQESISKRSKLMEMFSETQRNYLRVMKTNKIKGDEIEFDGLEQLTTLSSAIDLKRNIFDLVNCFLEYVSKNDTILVIPIDDIDLNSKSATSMVEQIRKYLELPNILILFSVKLNQLYQLKRRELVKQNYDTHNTVSLTEIDEMVEKYLTKLIPNNHRFYMPDGTYYWTKELVIKDGNEEKYRYPSVRQAVPALIFQKVRFLFYNSPVKTSPIVPDNLRDLRQLIRLLYDMGKPEDDKQDIKNGERKPERKNFQSNKSIFIKYLIETWMPSHLSSEARALISDWLNVNDPIQMNASALSTLRLEFKDEIADILNEKVADNGKGKDSEKEMVDDNIVELRMILNPRNKVYNIAIGDVLSVTDYLERLDISYEESCFLFMMKTMYSITLFECYDSYTEQLDYNEAKKVTEDPQITTGDYIVNGDLQADTVLKRSLFEDMKLPEYFKLLGGRLFNTQINVVLPKSNKTNVYRSARIINKEALNQLIDECCEEGASSDKIMMAEFFMLCTARTVNRRNDKTKSANYNEPDFRTSKTLAYRDDIGLASNPYFDLSSFLYNVLTYEQCVSRFPRGDAFLEKIKSLESEPDGIVDNHSLHSAFRFYTGTEMRFDRGVDYKRKISGKPVEYKYNQQKDTKHRLISWAAIRNFEVLADLVSFLDEQVYRSTGDDIVILQMFFSNLASYSLYSYDLRNEDDNPSKSDNYHSINFRFAWIVANFLNNVSKDETLRDTFDKIYNGFEVNGKAEWEFNESEFAPKRKFLKQSTLNKRIKKQYPIYLTGNYLSILDGIFPPNGNDDVTKDQYHELYTNLMNSIRSHVNGTTPSNN